ncbi:DUF485 domain-containing protein [Amycolatopsis albispora]|uniref:DUF485 domain-containing protein n=1 Tax=Amycolatopsis albispora TaxID=1804986 RepID=UPI0013B3D7CB|nr:DUF485 domain-containing protein [Amycolatopsis albispora]
MRKRIALVGGTSALAVFLAVPVLTVFTPLFDGWIGPVGAGYVAGAFAIVFPLGAAFAYSRWADRWERRNGDER